MINWYRNYKSLLPDRLSDARHSVDALRIGRVPRRKSGIDDLKDGSGESPEDYLINFKAIE